MFDAITYALAKAFTKKAIAEADAKNMKVKDYDSVGNGVVNDSRKLGGNLPSYYASAASIFGKMDKSVYDKNDNGIVDNAEKVNNHTVESDVPANAEFTDTKTLSGLTDTDINNPTEGQALLYNSETEKFENQDISSGGSFITLTTTTEQGENVSMSIGGATYTGTFSAQGVCTFEGVKETGTATIATANASTTFEIMYFGAYTIILNLPATYGVEWDGTATTLWTRTDDAENFIDPNPYYYGMSDTPSSPFDDIMPWSGMQIIEDPDAGTLVKIPKFWYKLTQNGAGLKIQISAEQRNGFHVSPAHMDRGDGNGERDVIYVGRYHCGETAYKSATNQTPKISVTKANFRSNVHSLGTDIWLMDFATRFSIWLLYLVEFADWDSQSKIGYACGGGSYIGQDGYTDSMPYHTGTTYAGRDRNGLGEQYRHIEGLWDNVKDWLDGCYNNTAGFNIILNPSSFNDSSGGALVGGKVNDGYPSEFVISDENGSFPMFIPSSNHGTNASYTCDYWSMANQYINVGGNYYANRMHGMFSITTSSTDSSNTTGARIMKLPNNS